MAFLDDWKEKYKELLSNKQVQGLSRAAQSAGREFSSGAKQLGSAVGTAAVSPWENKRLQQEQRTADLIANTGRLRQARGADGSKYFNSAQRLTQNVANQQMGLGNRQVQAERDAKAGAFRTGLTVLGAGAGGRAIAGSALLGGGMGGLLSAATGQDVYEGIGSGVGSSMRYAGLNKLTAPLIDPFVQASGRFGANALGTIGKYGARAVAHGGANVLEDQYYTRLAESRAPSAMENLFSFGVGAAVSPMVNFDPKNSFIEIVDDKLTINPERYRDVLGRYAKEENIDLKQAKKVVDKWIGQQNEPTTIRIMQGDELVEEIVPKWRATMMDQPVGMSIKNVREGIVQPTKGDMGLLEEARKYKSVEEFIQAQNIDNKPFDRNDRFMMGLEVEDSRLPQGYKINQQHIDSIGDEHIMAINVYDKDGKLAGSVDYGIYHGEPNIKMIEVFGEHKRKGIATAMLDKLQEMYPDKKIYVGMSTPDGTALLKNYDFNKTKSQLTNIYNQAKSSLPQPTKGGMQALQDSGLGMGFAGTPRRTQPQSTVGGVNQTGNKTLQTLPGTIAQNTRPASINEGVSLPQTVKPVQKTPVLNPSQTPRIVKPVPTPNNQSTAPVSSLDSIISEGRKSIGSATEKPGQTIKQSLDTIYTQWVDRFHPLSKASKKVKVYLKGQGKELSPEVDPDYLVRRLTGAGAIADQRFKTKLNPILKELETSGISKPDMDTYLAHNRMLGFDQAGREIYGVDPAKSKQVVQALEQKYPGIKDLAQKFYQYQDEGLQELAKAGFFTKAEIQAMRSQNPNYAPLYRVMDDVSEYLGLPTRKTMQGTSPVKKIKGSKRQIESPVESIIGNTFSQRAAIEKNRVAQSIVNLQNITDMGFKKVSKAGNDTITVWNNGKKEYWSVGQDIADVAKGVNEEAVNFALKLAQAPAQLLRQGATGRNPAFMIPNVVRDQLDAGITSKYGYIPFIDYVKGLIEVGKKDLNTTFGTSFNTKIYDDWANSGAKIDLGELSGKKDITKLFNEKKAKRGLFNWLTSGLDLMGRYSEQPTRVGLYKKAFEKTGDPLKAMMESRDATVDFARMGSKMKVANSIIPFLNVGVQGFDKLARAFKNNPGKVLLNMGIYAATPATVITAYNLKNYPEEYSEIPQYDKDSNFVIVKGRNADGTVDYFTIPKGNVVPIVANPIQAFMEHLAGVDGKSFSELATSVLSETLPVLESGNTPMEVVAKTAGSITPQIVKPIIEDVANRNFYKYDSKKEAQGRDSGVIVPSYLKSKPAYQQTYEFTPQMYQKMGAALNVSPLRLKNLMEGYMAGYAKIPAQVVEMLYASSRGEKINPNDKTILSRFVKQTYPTSSSKAKEKEQPEVPGFMDRMTGKVSAAEETGMELPENTEDLGVLYDDVTRVVDNYQENKIKSQYGLVDKTLEEYQTEVDQALALKKRIEQERPEQILTLEVDQHVSGGGKTTEERAEWAYKKIYDIPQDKRADFVKRLLEEKVLTKSVVEAIKDQYGLLIPLYNEGGKVKRFSSGGGSKPKKLPDSVFKTVKLVRPRSSGSTPRVRVNRKRTPNRVTLKAKQVVKI